MPSLFLSLAVTLAMAPLVRHLLLRRGVIDVPNQRSSHSVPVPRGGGIACLAGAAAGVVLAAIVHDDVPWLALGGVALLALVGYADDRGTLAAAPRLGAQIAVGALVASAFGGAFWILAGAVCLPVLVNAVNFMDGINGITGLNMAVWGAVAVFAGYAQNARALIVIGAVTAGSAIGFLPWNAPTARMFLGDTGSYFFGAMVASGIFAGTKLGASPVVLVAPLAIYLADTGVTLARRAARGVPVMTAHREHVYQRLVSEGGLPHIIVAAFSAILALAITVAWLPGSVPLGLGVTAIILTVYLTSPLLLAWLRPRVPQVVSGTD